MQWAKQLKIALAEEDELKIEKTIESLPTFETLEQMKEAAHLMQEAYVFLNTRKEEYASKLLKLKKQREFLSSNITQTNSFNQSH